MAGIAFIKHGTALLACDKFAEDALAKFDNNQAVIVRLEKSRSGRHHNLFFGGLRLLFDNTEGWKSEDDLRQAILIEAGYTERRQRLDGTVYEVARSMSYANLDQHEFQELFERCRDVVQQHFGFDPWETLIRR